MFDIETKIIEIAVEMQKMIFNCNFNPSMAIAMIDAVGKGKRLK